MKCYTKPAAIKPHGESFCVRPEADWVWNWTLAECMEHFDVVPTHLPPARPHVQGRGRMASPDAGHAEQARPRVRLLRPAHGSHLRSKACMRRLACVTRSLMRPMFQHGDTHMPCVTRERRQQIKSNLKDKHRVKIGDQLQERRRRPRLVQRRPDREHRRHPRRNAALSAGLL